MSNNTTPEGTDEPALADRDNPADGVPGGVEVTGVMSMQPEYVLTHSSSVCKKVYVNSAGNDETMLYVLSIGLEHDHEPLPP